MTISADLFRAILAMDSYNRGYNQGIDGLGGLGSQIGTATLNSQSNTQSDSTEVTYSFYAASYTWNGNTVISYRGTDQALPSWENVTFGDFASGWFVGAGSAGELQAKLAVEFYRNVAGAGTDPRTANIELTGHSLGGGR